VSGFEPTGNANAESVRSIAELAVDRFGGLDTWAHVAGIAGPHCPPHLRRNGGALVVVSSEIAKRGFPLLSSYSAAKHGVDGFLEAIRLELRQEQAPIQNAMQRLSPRLTDLLSRRLVFALGRSKEPKAVGDDSLFDAPHGDDRERGVVSTFHR
jgi:hypothetical protein